MGHFFQEMMHPILKLGTADPVLVFDEVMTSFGFGTNISMPNGVLTLIYGLGRKIGNRFLLRTGKIHLGFTSYF